MITSQNATAPKLKALSNPHYVNVGKSVKNLEKQMKGFGPGSRAIVQISKGRAAHVFIAENIRGKISYVDPQTNKRYPNLSLSKVSQAGLVRLDNQQFAEYARNAFTTQRI